MITLYALVVSVCLSNGQCEALSPEVYEDLTLCVMEVAHQRAQGFDSYCEEIQEEGTADAEAIAHR